MTNAVATWVGFEVVHSGAPQALVEWAGAEAIHSGAPNAWVSWVGGEVYHTGAPTAEVFWVGVEVWFEITESDFVIPTGEVAITGYPPLFSDQSYQPPTDEITITGYAPTLVLQTDTYVIPTGHVIIGGFPPFTDIFPWFDWRATVISQYANSPTILQLVELFNEWIAPGANLNAFYNLIWNIDTAQGYGLDVWGRILGVGRVLTLPGSELFFGFEESTTEVGFDQAPFFDGTSPFTSNFSLSDAAYRQLLLAKALANICDGSIPAINQILINLFGASGNAYCTDGENMTMTYTFEFPLNPVQNAIVHNSGVLPKPAGVALTIVAP